MRSIWSSIVGIHGVLLLFVQVFLNSGCSTTSDTLWLAGGITSDIVLGVHSPTQEFEQIYYLGVFELLYEKRTEYI